jgi:hypothetical protein
MHAGTGKAVGGCGREALGPTTRNCEAVQKRVERFENSIAQTSDGECGPCALGDKFGSMLRSGREYTVECQSNLVQGPGVPYVWKLPFSNPLADIDLGGPAPQLRGVL